MWLGPNHGQPRGHKENLVCNRRTRLRRSCLQACQGGVRESLAIASGQGACVHSIADRKCSPACANNCPSCPAGRSPEQVPETGHQDNLQPLWRGHRQRPQAGRHPVRLSPRPQSPSAGHRSTRPLWPHTKTSSTPQTNSCAECSTRKARPPHRQPFVFLPAATSPHLENESRKLETLIHGRTKFSWFSLANATSCCASTRSVLRPQIPDWSMSLTRRRVSISRA